MMNMIKVENLNKNIKGKSYFEGYFLWGSWRWNASPWLVPMVLERQHSWTVCSEINWSPAVKYPSKACQWRALSRLHRSYLPQEKCHRSEIKGQRVDCFLSKHLPKSLEQPGNRSTIAVWPATKRAIRRKLSVTKRLFSFVLTLIGRPKLVF